MTAFYSHLQYPNLKEGGNREFPRRGPLYLAFVLLSVATAQAQSPQCRPRLPGRGAQVGSAGALARSAYTLRGLEAPRVPAVAAAAAAPGGRLRRVTVLGRALRLLRYVPELGPLWREQPLSAAAGPAAAAGGAS